MSTRIWKCLLAGGPYHGRSVTKISDAALTFPPTLDVEGELYHPMTMTSTTRVAPETSGTCVMAHRYATLEQVNEAHRSLLSSDVRRPESPEPEVPA